MILLLIAAALARPALTGPERTMASEDGFFVVHWTEEGGDAPAGGSDGDVPLAVTRTLDALALARETYEERGWRPLVADDGDGGGPELDLYLMDVDINGWARPVEVDDGLSCWIEVDAGLSGVGGLVLESVVVHELHHCVQYRYTGEAHPWIYEATATWEQYRVVTDPTLELALGFLYLTRLGEPERAMDDRGDRYEYAGLVFLKYLWERGGEAGVTGFWEALALDPDWQAAMPGDPHATFLDYATWNGFACGRDDGAHYDPEVAPCVAEGSVPVEAVQVGAAFPVVHEEAPMTASYAEVAAAGDTRPVALSCTAPGDGGVLGVRLVALDGEGVGGEEAEARVTGETLDVRLEHALDPEGGVLAVFGSTGSRGVDVTCTARRVEPVVEAAACACATGPAGSTPSFLALLALLAAKRPVGRKRRAARNNLHEAASGGKRRLVRPA